MKWDYIHAHIYDRHVPLVEEMIKNPQFPAPTFKMNPDIKNFYDFKVEDFALENYQYNKFDHKIEVAI